MTVKKLRALLKGISPEIEVAVVEGPRRGAFDLRREFTIKGKEVVGASLILLVVT